MFLLFTLIRIKAVDNNGVVSLFSERQFVESAVANYSSVVYMDESAQQKIFLIITEFECAVGLSSLALIHTKAACPNGDVSQISNV